MRRGVGGVNGCLKNRRAVPIYWKSRFALRRWRHHLDKNNNKKRAAVTENLRIPADLIQHLIGAPDCAVTLALGGVRCRVYCAIPESNSRINRRYAKLLGNGALERARNAGIDDPFRHFGLILHFAQPTLLPLYGDDLTLAPDVKRLIGAFGAVIIRNAYMAEELRSLGQRNIFPDLDFHYDRSPDHDNQFSLFYRDPFDPAHRKPRDTSTLIVPNIVAFLQNVEEGNPPEDVKRSLYPIFKASDLGRLVGDIILESPWRESEGTGEVCIFDNRTVMHASYYRAGKGYPIGVQYLY